MTFLEPLVLAALPLIALPVLIHLIHQRRYRTVPWAAMMFLVSANSMSRGMARLRHLLILLMRMAAVGALIFAISRPLTSGWWSGLGMARLDATLVLLDRSASMEALDLQTGESKRSTGLRKLADLLEKRGWGSELVLIDSASQVARTLDSPEALTAELPVTAATATSADIPGMVEAAIGYLEANRSGRADIWICSDLSANDWNPGSGRWSAIREQLASLEGVRVHLLAYADRPPDNLAVRVTDVRRRERGGKADLLLDVRLDSNAPLLRPEAPRPRMPVEIEVGGVRSSVELELDAEGAVLEGHRIPIDRTLRSGWGLARLPGDSNPLDNRCYFVFSEPAARRAFVVTNDARTGESFRRALAIPPELGPPHQATVISPARASEIDGESTGLIVWQAPLPDGPAARQVERFVAAGGVLLLFPPERSDDREIFGFRWGPWRGLADEGSLEPATITWWRGDADLFAHSDGGDPLPLDDLRIHRACAIERAGAEGHEERPGTSLAKVGDGQDLLVRVATDRGGVYFCGTLPVASCSSLERDAVAFYVMLQRALEEGCRALETSSSRDAATEALADAARWELVAPTDDAPTVSEHGRRAGVYRYGDVWVAVNRSPDEDRCEVASAEAIDGLFAGVPYERIDDRAGDTSSLVREIWRLFLLAMALALIIEALLCLPERAAHGERADGLSATPGRRLEGVS